MVEPLGNTEVAAALQEIGDILEIQGENRFRVLGYRRAAENIRGLDRDIRQMWQESGLAGIPGVGEGLAPKIDELLRTGHLAYLERLREKVPPGVVELLAVPDVGPAKARAMWERLGITGVEAAEDAARAGKLRDLPGFGPKSEARILAGIEAFHRQQKSGRTPIGVALPMARALLAQLRGAAPGIERAEVAGSLRRWRETIGDVDLLVAAADPEPVMAAFRALPQVAEVLLTGPTKTSVRLRTGMQVDLRVVNPGSWGTALQYFTGSQAHSVELRELALRQGWSLNEYALTPLLPSAGAASPAAAGQAEGSEAARKGVPATFREEEALYAALGLLWIPPELRESQGEIRYAQQGRLPRLIALGDIRGQLHAHSTYSDGRSSLAEMAAAARAHGYDYFAFTDHSQSLGVTGGMTVERMAAPAGRAGGCARPVPRPGHPARRRGGGARRWRARLSRRLPGRDGRRGRCHSHEPAPAARPDHATGHQGASQPPR